MGVLPYENYFSIWIVPHHKFSYPRIQADDLFAIGRSLRYLVLVPPIPFWVKININRIMKKIFVSVFLIDDLHTFRVCLSENILKKTCFFSSVFSSKTISSLHPPDEDRKTLIFEKKEVIHRFLT